MAAHQQSDELSACTAFQNPANAERLSFLQERGITTLKALVDGVYALERDSHTRSTIEQLLRKWTESWSGGPQVAHGEALITRYIEALKEGPVSGPSAGGGGQPPSVGGAAVRDDAALRAAGARHVQAFSFVR